MHAFPKNITEFAPSSSAGTGTDYASWLFQWAFAATAASIVSGALAERCSMTSSVVLTVCLVGFIYPLVVLTVWGSDGMLSTKLGSDDKGDYFRGCGAIDFAGSGVVHLTAGAVAFFGGLLVGPRRAFVEGNMVVPEYGPIFQTLGTLILWFGWCVVATNSCFFCYLGRNSLFTSHKIVLLSLFFSFQLCFFF